MNYYEQQQLWDKNYLEFADEKMRIGQIIQNLPYDFNSLLDVGCGNGAFLNHMQCQDRFQNIQLCGIDQSSEALKYVQTNKIKGSIKAIPFEDNSFDMVTSFEVLEHIKSDEYVLALKELQRVSRKYIMITVPHEEVLSLNQRVCPRCKCRFNPYQHVRSFSISTLRNLFPPENFVCKKSIAIGPKIRRLIPPYLHIRNLFNPIEMGANQICPQCNYQKTSIYNSSTSKKGKMNILRSIELLAFGTKKSKWLLSLYIKN